jgi:hypothetical protein
MNALGARLATKLGAPVALVVPIEQDYLVLLDYFAAGQAHIWNNFFRVGPNDEIVWRSRTPRSGDLFTKIDWDGTRLVAWTWECYRLTINPATGTVIESVFTK